LVLARALADAEFDAIAAWNASLGIQAKAPQQAVPS
jgi:hypothetical protein